MKSEIFSSENLYVKLFHIADTNYNLFLEEKMNKLTKKDLFGKKKKVNGKMQIVQKKIVSRAILD